jgi:hypothetical protein
LVRSKEGGLTHARKNVPPEVRLVEKTPESSRMRDCAANNQSLRKPGEETVKGGKNDGPVRKTPRSLLHPTRDG